MLDILHFLDLGICARLIGIAIQRLLQCGTVYRNQSSIQGYTMGMLKFNLGLRQYYRDMRKELRGTPHLISPVNRVTLKMIGLGA